MRNLLGQLYRQTTNIEIKKYLFYSIGEILLIVIGILVAFQLDQWQNDRAQRKLEIQTLIEIKEGFRRDVRDIKFNIFLHESSSQSCKIVLDYFEKDFPYNDSLAQHFGRILWYSRLTINQGAFETLKSRGLDLIGNVKLREDIIRMCENYYTGIKIFEKDTFLDESYVSEVIGKRFDKTEISKISDDGKVLAGTMIPHDFEKLKRDKDYIHVVKTQLSKNDFLIKWFMEKTVKNLEQLTTDVDKEILHLSE
jgi:hypothetical protein